MALAADTALVGASEADDSGTNSGAAYFFVRSATTWAQRQKLLAVDSAAGDQFGRSVSLSADTALVGAHRDGDFGTDSGAAYLFGLANSACEPCPGPDGDDDCAESCDEATGTCTAADPDGTACRDEGVCRDGSCTHGDPVGQPCTDDSDCAEGLTCSADGHCESSEPATDTAAPTDEGGCGCRLAGEGDADNPWPATLLVALGLLARARRRWRRTSRRRSPSRQR